MPIKLLTANQIDGFGKALKSKLSANSPFAKQYLRLLVSGIKVNREELQMQGSYAAFAGAILSNGAAVPGFAPKWLPDQGSNLGPAD